MTVGHLDSHISKRFPMDSWCYSPCLGHDNYCDWLIRIRIMNILNFDQYKINSMLSEDISHIFRISIN